MIKQYEPWIGEEERQAVHKYMATRPWLTEFKKTQELEEAVAAYVGAKHCVFMPSATLALYAMLKVAGIGRGDTVVVPAFTMVATANAVAMTGANVQFVDVCENTLCLDIDALPGSAYAIAKAVLFVSLNGRVADLANLAYCCKRDGASLLEDAAQSLGSRWHGRHLGTFGEMGVLSFSCQKIVTTGQGGCVLTDNDKLAHKLRRFKDFGRPRGGSDEYESYGINLKFTDLQAVVGLEQMKKLPWRVERKKAMFALYRERLEDIGDLYMPPTNLTDVTPWFVDVFTDQRDELAAYLLERGVETRKVYPALHTTPAWKSHNHSDCPVAERIARRGLWLPSSVQLTDDQVHEVCDKIVRFYAEVAN